MTTQFQSLDSLKKHPMVIYPSLSGEVALDSSASLIFLEGSTTGIFVGETWHRAMLNYLSDLGYKGKVYIPVRLDADDINDYSSSQVAQTDANNQLALKRSDVVIYWATNESHVIDVANLFGLIWDCAYAKASKIRTPQYLFGAEEKSDCYRSLEERIDSRVNIYTQMSLIVKHAVQLAEDLQKR